MTNGLFIDKYTDIINSCVDVLSVSLDGPKKIHESIRGVKGIYNNIIDNIRKINKKT